jgi:uncharacterized protein (DUF2147 family)
MKKISSIVFMFLISLAFANPSFAQIKGDDVLGVWLNEDKDAHVEIVNKDGKYFGEVIWLLNPIDEKTGKAKLDKENPDEELQKRPVMGLQLLADFEFDDDEWEDGTIYDPKSGKTYSCYMEFSDKTKDKLKVRGFIGVSLLGRTTYWTRVK